MFGIATSLLMCGAVLTLTARNWHRPQLLAKQLLALLVLLPFPTLVGLRDSLVLEEPKWLLTLPAFLTSLVLILRGLLYRPVLLCVVRRPLPVVLFLAFCVAVFWGGKDAGDHGWFWYGFLMIIPLNIAFLFFGLVTPPEEIGRGSAFTLALIFSCSVQFGLLLMYLLTGRVDTHADARGVGMAYNSNSIVGLITLYAPLWWQEMQQRQIPRRLTLLVLSVSLLLSVSRSALFAVLIHAWLWWRSARSKPWILSLVLACIVAAFFVTGIVNVEPDAEATTLLGRLAALPDAFLYRYDLFAPYLDLILESLLVSGIGLGQTMENPLGSLAFSTLHVLSLSLAYELGLLSALLLIIFLLASTARAVLFGANPTTKTLGWSIAWFLLLAHTAGIDWYTLHVGNLPNLYVGATVCYVLGVCWRKRWGVPGSSGVTDQRVRYA